jgi:hypothetical protein
VAISFVEGISTLSFLREDVETDEEDNLSFASKESSSSSLSDSHSNSDENRYSFSPS